MLALRQFTYLLLLMIPATLAAEERPPAVDGVTGKFTLQYGRNHIDGLSQDTRSVSASGAVNFGLNKLTDGEFGKELAINLRMHSQLNFQDGEETSSHFGVASIQWRHPEIGSLGPEFTYGENAANREYFQFGVIGELFLGPVTLSGTSRYLEIEDQPSYSMPFRGNATLYIMENWSVTAGYAHTYKPDLPDTDIISGRTEWLIISDSPVGVSASVQSTYRLDKQGSGDYAFRGGITIYAGQKGKTLVRRHREDNL